MNNWIRELLGLPVSPPPQKHINVELQKASHALGNATTILQGSTVDLKKKICALRERQKQDQDALDDLASDIERNH